MSKIFLSVLISPHLQLCLIDSILNRGHVAIAAATLSTEFSGRIAVRTASSSQRFLSATLTAAKNQ